MTKGWSPKETKLTSPMTFQGVGEGCPKAEWSVGMPIAVPTIENDEESTQLMTMNIPVLNQGDGDDLTILLGLDSIEEKKGVVQTDPEHRVLTFPGPGGLQN